MSTDAKRKERNRRYYQKLKARREALKQQSTEWHVEHGDLNSNLHSNTEPFPSFLEWHKANDLGSFEQYLEEKRTYQRENEVRPLGNAYNRAVNDNTKCKVCKKPLAQCTIEDGHTTCTQHRRSE